MVMLLCVWVYLGLAFSESVSEGSKQKLTERSFYTVLYILCFTSFFLDRETCQVYDPFDRVVD
jgi:hypothetical protein